MPSNCFWSLLWGIPYEICIALANAVSSAPWINYPLTANSTYVTNLVNLVYSGTGMQSGFSALNSNLNAVFEVSNEVWNGGTFNQPRVASSLGKALFNTGNDLLNNQNFYGMTCALNAQTMQTTLGGAFSRCFPVAGAQTASGSADSGKQILNTSAWGSGPASSYPIKFLAINTYWPPNLPNTTDQTTMTGVATPLDDFFACMTGDVGTAGNGSHTYSSIGATGFQGALESQVSAYVTLMASYPNQTLVSYEGGQNVLTGGGITAWNTMAKAAQLDARMATAYNTFLTWWATHVGPGFANIQMQFADCNPLTSATWGIIENVQQSPLSGVVKWQALQSYIA